MGWLELDGALRELTARGAVPAASLCVRLRGKTVFDGAYGVPNPETGAEATVRTRYDLASVSKLFAATAFFRLCEQGVFSLDEPVCKSFPEFTGPRDIRASANALAPGDDTLRGTAEASLITWRQVLVHNAGFGWFALNSFPSPQAALDHLLHRPLAYRPGTEVLYTDLGLILLGRAMELRCEKPLDVLVREQVCAPLGLEDTGYFRVSHGAVTQDVAPTEYCTWRGCRMHGLVHDENAYFLDGVAGHAGVFSTARDVAAFAQAWLDAWRGGGLVPRETARALTAFQQQNTWDRRAVAFQLRIIDRDAHSFPLSRTTFGHTGFTGTCMWVDPERELCFALLTNDVYGGRENRTMGRERKAIVERIIEAVDSSL